MMWLLAQAAGRAGPTPLPAAGAEEAYLYWGIILLALAVGLLLLELVVPSGGMIGLLCAIATIGSIIAFFRYDTTVGFVALGLYLVLGPIAIVFGFRIWVHSPLASNMILGADEANLEESEERSGEAERRRRERHAELRQLIGAEGTTVTALRPVGFVKIGGRRIDALAEMSVIEANVPVVVVDVYDNQVKVRPV